MIAQLAEPLGIGKRCSANISIRSLDIKVLIALSVESMESGIVLESFSSSNQSASFIS